MIKRQISEVHGHTIAELAHLLRDGCDLFDGDVNLENGVLGGWSNINIRGQSAGIDFVLKLPWQTASHDTGLYKHLYDISLFFNKLDIAALPLSMGQLSDTNETPFIIFEYVDGVIHDSLTEITTQEITALKNCHQLLSHQKPPGLKRYKSPSDLLTRTHAFVENHEGHSDCSKEVVALIDAMNRIYPEVLSYTDSLGAWSPSVMHGDLWIPNVIFDSGKVTLLDFEACAYGSHLYDLAYLLESPVGITENEISGLIRPEEKNPVNNLRPTVVAFLVEWTLERLLSMESGLVEPNLTTTESRSALIGYARSKTTRLKTLLS